MKIKIVLLVCCVGFCVALSPKKNSNTKKEVKEKRDAPVATPYQYEMPQKEFKTPSVTYYKTPQGIHYAESSPQLTAALMQSKQAPKSHYGAPAAHQGNQGYSKGLSSAFVDGVYSPVKAFHELNGYNFGGFKDFSTPPHFDGFIKYEPINSLLDEWSLGSSGKIQAYPSFGVPSFSPYTGHVVENSYAVPAPHQIHNVHAFHAVPQVSYSFPGHLFQPHGQQVVQQAHSSPMSAAHMSNAAQQHYANGEKGLGHYASYLIPAKQEATAYVKPTYEQSNLYALYGEQTEKPFKASPYMGAHHVPANQDSYSEQSVTNAKPLNSYIPPKESLASNSYVVNKEYQHLNTYAPSKGVSQVSQTSQGSHAPQISNSYLPASKGYAPAMQHYEVSQFSYQTPAKDVHTYAKDDQIYNSYQPAQELSYAAYAPTMEYQISNHYPEKQAQNTYQISSIYPSKEIHVSNTYLPSKENHISNTYLPSKENHVSNTYLPSKENHVSNTYLPSKENHISNTYLPSTEHQVTNTYLPTKKAPISHTYLPSKESHVTNTYLPSKEPQVSNTYLPAKEVQSPNHYSTSSYKENTPVNTYLPAKEFLPPKQTATTQFYEKPSTHFLAPSKTYLPSQSNSNSYTTPKATYTVQPVKNNYLPPKNAYLPSSPPKNTYLPSSQTPSNTYLPTQHYSAAQETSQPHSQGQAQAYETEHYEQSSHVEASQHLQHSGSSQYIPQQQHSYSTQEYAPSSH